MIESPQSSAVMIHS